jgi:hypothetical protein
MKSTIVSVNIIDNNTGKYPNKRAIAEFVMSDGKRKTIPFGLYNSLGTYFDGASDIKRINYINRHSKMKEDWNKSGIMTPGWLSRFVLWEKRGNKQTMDYLKQVTGIPKLNVSLSQYPVM